MSSPGPAHDIRIIVQPLLDAIAPDRQINILECHNSNGKISPRGWHDDFFEKKIRMPLLMHSLEYAVWSEKENAEKRNDLVNYLFHPEIPSALGDYVNTLLRHATDYLRHIHTDVSQKLDDPKALNYSQDKAQQAFERMAKIQLAINALGLDPPRELSHQLTQYIFSQANFSYRKILSLRTRKAIATAFDRNLFVQQQHSAYFCGVVFDKHQGHLNALQDIFREIPLSFSQYRKGMWMGVNSIVKRCALSPWIHLQKACRLVKQVSALPFRCSKALIQDLPLIGISLGSLLEYANTAKDNLVLPASSVGLLYLLFTVPKFAVLPLVISGGTMAAQLIGMHRIAKGAVAKHQSTQQDVVSTFVENNLRDFNLQMMSDRTLQEVLTLPVTVPPEVLMLLSQEQIQNLRWQIYQRRLALCSVYFHAPFPERIATIEEQPGVWLPIPLYQPPAQACRTLPSTLRLGGSNPRRGR